MNIPAVINPIEEAFRSDLLCVLHFFVAGLPLDIFANCPLIRTIVNRIAAQEVLVLWGRRNFAAFDKALLSYGLGTFFRRGSQKLFSSLVSRLGSRHSGLCGIAVYGK